MTHQNDTTKSNIYNVFLILSLKYIIQLRSKFTIHLDFSIHFCIHNQLPLIFYHLAFKAHFIHVHTVSRQTSNLLLFYCEVCDAIIHMLPVHYIRHHYYSTCFVCAIGTTEVTCQFLLCISAYNKKRKICTCVFQIAQL